ncbi:TPA: glycosyltransferase family 2 protein [Streptococcus pneumoniae]
MRKIRTKSTMYITLLLSWLALLLLVMPAFIHTVRDASEYQGVLRPLVLVLVVLNALFISYFWLNGLKDIIYVSTFYLNNYIHIYGSSFKKSSSISEAKKVILLYCTANDFVPECLVESMQQDYANFETVILDDSKSEVYKQQVDEFAKKYNVSVIRRDDRNGFKAGNINNYLKNKNDYDYFVLLDSDEIIPSNFIKKSLAYFEKNRNLGILQATHVASRNRNLFMDTLAIGVDSHWPVYQKVKHYYGFLSLLGHGAMISKDCYQAAGGFPHVVAEDLCFSIGSRIKGDYHVGFADDIVCQEEYPVDYLAFKKRHSKWTQGNMEFIKRYTPIILKSKLKWQEKLDIVLFTYNLPLTAVFAFYIVMNLILFPLLHFKLEYPAWLLIPTVIFLLAPMSNDIIFYSRKINIFQLIFYVFTSFMLFGSMFYVSLVSSFKSIFGKKAVFLVTPKDTRKITVLEALKLNYKEIIFACTLMTISILTSGNILPVILIAIPSLFSPVLTLYSNYRVKK